MQTVGRAVRRSGRMGDPLPEVYPSLTQAELFFRRGGTSLLAGWPGAFKSTFALNLLIHWARQGMTALYISADSDEFTVAKRVVAMITGTPMKEVEAGLRRGEYQNELKQLTNVHWEFRPLNVEQIDERLVAMEKMHGKKPDVVFVDNLMNMVPNPTDYGAQMTLTRDLDTMARGAKSHIMILHHTHEGPQNKSRPATPQAIWEVHGKVNQFPRMVLTLAANADADKHEAHLMVAGVKNTNGPSDRTGQTYEDFIIDTQSARIRGVNRV
jgi:RecA-family ATPase